MRGTPKDERDCKNLALKALLEIEFFTGILSAMVKTPYIDVHIHIYIYIYIHIYIYIYMRKGESDGLLGPEWTRYSNVHHGSHQVGV